MLFWMGVEWGWHLTMEYIRSAENESDILTRDDAVNDVRLLNAVFLRLSQQAGGLNVDWCASVGNAHCDGAGRRLPFVSRYLQAEAAAVDMLAQDLRWVPGLTGVPARGLCYPPPALTMAVV